MSDRTGDPSLQLKNIHMDLKYRRVKVDSPDMEALMSLIERAHDTRIDKDLWAWKFRKNPYRDGIKVYAVENESGFVACTARFPFVLKMSGKDFPVFFNGDSVVDPAFRNKGIMTGLYRHASQDLSVTYSKGPNPEMKGLMDRVGYIRLKPDTVMVAVLHPVKWLVNRMVFRLPDSDFIPDFDGFGDFQEIGRFGSEFDAFLERVTESYSGIPVKNSAYMNWRYVDIPHVRYNVFFRTRQDRILSCVVIRASGKRAFIVDMIWDPLSGDEPGRTLRFAMYSLGRSGFLSLGCWGTLKGLREALKTCGFRDSGRSIGFSVFGPGGRQSPYARAEALHFMDGDGDSEIYS